MRKQPTPSELAILDVLWSLGPATVREVHEKLNPGKSTGYTTTLKLLQIMVEKNLVRRDETQRAHVYKARIPRQQAQSQLVADLVDKLFGGSASGLVMHALSDKRASAAERAEIRKLLDEMERDSR
jgi:BlaI family penicillinase repressor